mgnify:CR=1 FL=1
MYSLINPIVAVILLLKRIADNYNIDNYNIQRYSVSIELIVGRPQKASTVRQTV